MNTQTKPVPDTLTKWVRTWLSTTSDSGDFTIRLLAGDGSPRQFFRVQTAKKSYVVMCDPTWAFSKDYAVHQQFLAQAKIPVPAFLREDPAAGFLAMEDLGDELLQLRILAEPKNRMPWLKKATELLADLHAHTFPVPQALPVSTRSFDAKKYAEEMAFTFEHLHEKFFSLPPPSAKQKEGVAKFCARLEALSPTVFCHRDYHCRNLLVVGSELSMIDFQDARLGPPHYDLASLVYDAYVEISDSDRQSLYAAYQSRLKGSALEKQIRWKDLTADLEFVAFQRVIKAAGSFASFFTRYGKDTHLPYLLPALRSAEQLARRAAGPLAEFKSLFPLADWIAAAEKKRS